MLPCKVVQTKGPRRSHLTHTHTPHPCWQGPEPRGQGPSTPHRRQGQQKGREDTAQGSGAQCPAGSRRLGTRVTAQAQPPGIGTASQHCAGLWACGRPGYRAPGQASGTTEKGALGRAAWKSHTGREHGAWLQRWCTAAGKEQPSEGLVSEALTFASVSGSFFHL